MRVGTPETSGLEAERKVSWKVFRGSNVGNGERVGHAEDRAAAAAGGQHQQGEGVSGCGGPEAVLYAECTARSLTNRNLFQYKPIPTPQSLLFPVTVSLFMISSWIEDCSPERPGLTPY